MCVGKKEKSMGEVVGQSRWVHTIGWPGVGGFSPSLSEEISSASPNKSEAPFFPSSKKVLNTESYARPLNGIKLDK